MDLIREIRKSLIDQIKGLGVNDTSTCLGSGQYWHASNKPKVPSVFFRALTFLLETVPERMGQQPNRASRLG